LSAAVEQINEKIKEDLRALPDLKISQNSFFNDDVWDFTNDLKNRLNSVSDYKLKINWGKYSETIPLPMIHSIKVVAYFYFKHPQFTAERGKTVAQGYKPNSVVSLMHLFLGFVEKMCLENAVNITGNEKSSYFRSFHDVEVSDLRKQAEITSRYSTFIKKALKSFCHPVIQKYLNCKIRWTISDIENLDFPKEMAKGEEGYSSQPLEDELFVFLSRKGTRDVLTFLKLMGIPNDYVPQEDLVIDPVFKKVEHGFVEMFEYYVYLRMEERDRATKKGKRVPTPSEYKEFKKKFGITRGELQQIIIRCHRAAMYLICQYVGIRYSEAASFQTECLKKSKRRAMDHKRNGHKRGTP
jgi:hypothetical protein